MPTLPLTPPSTQLAFDLPSQEGTPAQISIEDTDVDASGSTDAALDSKPSRHPRFFKSPPFVVDQDVLYLQVSFIPTSGTRQTLNCVRSI